MAEPRSKQLRREIEFVVREARSVHQVIGMADDLLSEKLTSLTSELLASFREPGELIAVVEGCGQTAAALELSATLVQEMVLRDFVPADWPTGRALSDRLSAANHPLAKLPLHRSPMECPVPLRHHGIWAWPDYAGGSAETPIIQRARSSDAADVTTDADAELIASAVTVWSDRSNGLYEARVFSHLEEIDGPSIFQAFVELPTGAMAGGAKFSKISAGIALKMLHTAASDGGAYSSGLYGAYGRLAAWDSVAGLVGKAPNWQFESLEDAAGKCFWVTFESHGGWFHQIAWDLGIGVVRPDRRTFAVLAATDTD